MEIFSNLEAVPPQILAAATGVEMFCSWQYPENVIKVANMILAYLIYLLFIFLARKALFWLKLSTFQFAVFRPVLVFLSIVLWTNDNYVMYNVSILIREGPQNP